MIIIAMIHIPAKYITSLFFSSINPDVGNIKNNDVIIILSMNIEYNY